MYCTIPHTFIEIKIVEICKALGERLGNGLVS